MVTLFIGNRVRRLYINFFLIMIMTLWVLNSKSKCSLLRLFNGENTSLSQRTCIIHAKQLTHNLTETNNDLTLSGYTRDNITEYQWNGYDRLRKFDFTQVKNCSIIYCGVNVNGMDGVRFANEYPSCYIWFLEPMPSFYQRFIHSSGWKRLMISDRAKLYNTFAYGLSNHSKLIDMVETNSSKGQGFTLFREDQRMNSHQRHKLVIRDVSEIMFELKVLNRLDTELNIIDGELTLLHMNCEGCEYEVLERLIDTDLIKHVRYLQFETHRPKSIQSTIAERYCSLQERLNNTHNREFGIPWAWERWTLF